MNLILSVVIMAGGSIMSNEKISIEEQLIKNTENLNDFSSSLLPWWSGSNSNLALQTEDNTESYLNGFYLYPIHEFCVNSECDDISKFINQRFQALYSAASSSNISVMITIQSKNGKTKLYIGLKSNKENGNNKEHFTCKGLDLI